MLKVVLTESFFDNSVNFFFFFLLYNFSFEKITYNYKTIEDRAFLVKYVVHLLFDDLCHGIFSEL